MAMEATDTISALTRTNAKQELLSYIQTRAQGRPG